MAPHPRHGGHSHSPKRNADGLVSFDKKAATRRHTHVRQVAPAPSSTGWESDAALDRRRRRVSYAEETMRRSKRRRNFIVAAVLIFAVCVALAVGVFVYFKSTDSNLDLSDDTVAAALVPAKEGEPYYVLCSADLRDKKLSYSRDEDIAYMLVRVDANQHVMTFLTIPTVLEMDFPDEEKRTLIQAYDTVSDGDIISAIAKFAGVDISHFITTDAQSIFNMVEIVGGLDMDITQEIDDPQAGFVVLDSGQAHLDGNAALTLLRATNFQDNFLTTADNRARFTTALLRASFDSEGLGFASIVSEASKYICTDLSTSEILSLGDTLRPIDSMTVYDGVVPFTRTKSTKENKITYNLTQADWAQMMNAIRETGNPDETSIPKSDVNASLISVEVQNGTAIDGAAASLANMLSEIGYQITGTGNVGDKITYPETLIIYTSDEFADAAKSIVRDVGIGRVVNGGDYYTSDADILAIIGADWA